MFTSLATAERTDRRTDGRPENIMRHAKAHSVVPIWLLYTSVKRPIDLRCVLFFFPQLNKNVATPGYSNTPMHMGLSGALWAGLPSWHHPWLKWVTTSITRETARQKINVTCNKFIDETDEYFTGHWTTLRPIREFQLIYFLYLNLRG